MHSSRGVTHVCMSGSGVSDPHVGPAIVQQRASSACAEAERAVTPAQEAQVYRQATIDQEGSTHSPLFSWDNSYPGAELLLAQLDASNSAHASAVRPPAPPPF